MHDSITIVGASLAGLRGAETLRNDGYDGRITVIGDETGEHRTTGRRCPSSCCRASGRSTARCSTGRNGWPNSTSTCSSASAPPASICAIDRSNSTAGGACRSTRLLVATGSSPRQLPNTPSLDGLYTLRTLDDSLAIRREFESGPRVVVVGAGFIGAEVAATARERGLEVTMIEALPVPLGRVLGEEMGALCGAIHRDHGVDLRLGVGVDGFDGHERVERVRLSDGSAVEADVVIVGVGVAPNTAWLDGSGLTHRQRCRLRRDVSRRARRHRRRRCRPVAQSSLRRSGAGRALGSRDRDGRARGATAAAERREATPFTPGAVLLERSVRPQDPTRGTPSSRRRGAHRDRVARRAALRRALRAQQASSWRCSASTGRATSRSIANSSSTARASTTRWPSHETKREVRRG